MMRVIDVLREHEQDLRRRFQNDLIGTGPVLTVTKIEGGRTRNAVPDFCTIALDFRVLPGMDMEAARREVIERIDALGLGATHSDLQIRTPPLNTAADDPFCGLVRDACRAESGREMALAGVPYGTDASWVSDRAPAVVLGPGDIAYAHAVDERIDIREVVTCARIYRRLLTPRA
jgi:acetylornithine deacetylase/succinyl-diaminopimelate desuccinylase-like protein